MRLGDGLCLHTGFNDGDDQQDTQGMRADILLPPNPRFSRPLHSSQPNSCTAPFLLNHTTRSAVAGPLLIPFSSLLCLPYTLTAFGFHPKQRERAIRHRQLGLIHIAQAATATAQPCDLKDLRDPDPRGEMWTLREMVRARRRQGGGHSSPLNQA